MKSLAIADPHIICRESLCSFIRNAEPLIRVEGFSTYQDLYAHIRSEKPDLVLLSSDLPEWQESPIEKDFGALNFSPKIGVIVSSVEPRYHWNYPVAGIFPRTLSCKDVLFGLQEMLVGKDFFPVLSSKGSLSSLRRAPDVFNLTTREKEVLNHLLKGASNKEIARALDLEIVTIKLHVRGICRKVNAANRTQAALIAIENGWH